jgi:hypothetical protein
MRVQEPNLVAQMIFQVSPAACLAGLVVIQQLSNFVEVTVQAIVARLLVHPNPGRDQTLHNVSGLCDDITIGVLRDRAAEVLILLGQLFREQRGFESGKVRNRKEPCDVNRSQRKYASIEGISFQPGHAPQRFVSRVSSDHEAEAPWTFIDQRRWTGTR